LPPVVRRNLSANFAAMMRWSAKQVLVIMLAFLVTASMGLSVVQAATFMPEPAKMSMMAGMDNSNSNGCKQCIGDMDGKAGMCAGLRCYRRERPDCCVTRSPAAANVFHGLRHLA
jgi:hypothetical protein